MVAKLNKTDDDLVPIQRNQTIVRRAMESMKLIKAPSESSGRPPSMEGGSKSDMGISGTPPSERGSSKATTIDPNPLLGNSSRAMSEHSEYDGPIEEKSSGPVRWLTRIIRAF